ncbi:hypothetical protein KC367_g6235 [Hortaea werneckii]|nr:hypothetical protein KC315_g14570 [Hortaea werneckii]KAI7466963.1 hypothetical protein KC357_g7223 [Hortaea werneckii]KAI7497012.1 hypothetical protein KC367_g6235 [Hortaea werneckii]
MNLLTACLALASPLISASPTPPRGPPHQETPPFRYLGRVNPATRELTWPATGVEFAFIGSSANVPLANITGTNSIDLTIDNDEPIVIDNVTGPFISTPTSLSHGYHTVQLRKKSEASFGSIFLGDLTTIDGLKASHHLNPHHNHVKRMEIIGDSISVGYGEDGSFPCTNTAAVEDGPNTYGAMTAAALDAEYSIVAWSGKGLIRNYVSPEPDTSPTMPELWTRWGAHDPDNSYPFPPSSPAVDLVVINLGTNDFGYLLTSPANGTSYPARPPITQAQWTSATVAFAHEVLAHYPGAELFLTSSPMLSDDYPGGGQNQHSTQSAALRAAVQEIGEEQAHFVNFPPQSTETLGCDYHPSVQEHEVMAGILTEAVRGVLGW